MESFEEGLKRLEELTSKLNGPSISLEEAMSSFEEGIKLSRKLEGTLDAMEGKIQILLNTPRVPIDSSASSSASSTTGRTRKAPSAKAASAKSPSVKGLRQATDAVASAEALKGAEAKGSSYLSDAPNLALFNPDSL